MNSRYLLLVIACILPVAKIHVHKKYSVTTKNPTKELIFQSAYWYGPAEIAVHQRHLRPRNLWEKHSRAAVILHTYPKCCKDDSGYFLFDRFLKNIWQHWDNIVPTKIFTHLRAKRQQPHTENHLILELKTAFVAQDTHDAKKLT